MIDTACILVSLGAVLWVIVRVAALDPLRPWVERLSPRSGTDERPADPWGAAAVMAGTFSLPLAVILIADRKAL